MEFFHFMQGFLSSGTLGFHCTKNKAFIKQGELSILAPEIILLYKSRNSENSDYQHDYDMVINTLDKERYNWFMNAMKIAYPKGHKWIK